MKLTIQFSRAMVLGVLLGFSSFAIAQGPMGTYQQTVADRANAVWDLPSIEEITSDYGFWVENEYTSLELWFPRSFEQSGSGKLVGSGQSTVSLELWDEELGYTSLDFPGTHKTSGSVTSSRGLCKVKVSTSVTGTAFLEGANRTLTASEAVSVSIDNSALLVAGSSKAKASASGLGSISSADSWSGEPLGIGEGFWTLRLVDLVTSGKTVTGTADVTLHSGAVHQFSVKGIYNSKNQTAKLVLMGLGVAKGANLTVTMDAANTITNIKGKLFGQMVNVMP